MGLVTHPACFLHHLGKMSLLFIFHSRNIVGDDPSILFFLRKWGLLRAQRSQHKHLDKLPCAALLAQQIISALK